jgi:hypothetical protein
MDKGYKSRRGHFEWSMSPEQRKLELRGGELWRRLWLNRHFAAALTTTSIASRVTLKKGVPFSNGRLPSHFRLNRRSHYSPAMIAGQTALAALR